MLAFKNFCAVLALAATCLVFGSGPIQAHQRDCGPACPPPPPQHIVLQVCHPCTGCTIDVPVCVPACCTGAPTVCFRNTLIGNGKTVFEWCCGYQVVVRYTHCGYRVVQRG